MKKMVVVKERDEWSSLAEFLGEMIAKYADVIDFDSLPDPDKYLMNRSLQDGYRTYFRQKGKTREFCLEFVYAP